MRLSRLFTPLAALIMVLALTLTHVSPVKATISQLTLHHRSCGSVAAYVVFDSYLQGIPPYFIAFAADLNNNNVFGEVGEPLVYYQIKTGGNAPVNVGQRLRFANALAEGSTVSVTAYEVDYKGNQLTKPLGAVSYVCSFRPVLDPLPAEQSTPAPQPAVVFKVSVPSVNVYAGPSVETARLGGLAQGETATVRAINRRGDWINIDFQGQSAWVMWRTNGALLGTRKSLPVLPNYEDSAQ